MEFLTDFGYVGMFVAAFIAGSVFPFSSEAIMTALLAAGLSPEGLFVWGTLGNIGGSMFNYGVGRLGRPEWVERYLHVPPEKVERTQRFLAGRGAWMGVLCFLPVLGSAIAVTLGLMRANVVTTLVSISIGKAVRYAVLIMAFVGLTSCSSQPRTDAAAQADSHIITVSIEPLRWAAEQVVDSTWEVRVLVPRGANPETYEPTVKEIMSLSQSACFFHTGGLGFELACMERMKQNAPATRFVNVGTATDSSSASSGHSHSHGDTHRHDPHIWASPRGMRHVVDVMAQTLDMPARFDATLRCDSLLRLIPRGTAFAIYHPSLTQLADDYGLHQLCIEADGKEPSPQHLARTIDACRRHNVKVVFVQQEFDRRGAEQIARQIGARIVSINPLGYDWPQEMQRVHDALR